MPKNNSFELDLVSIRIVRDSGEPLISDTPLNSPEKLAKLLHDETFADLDREIFAVVNLKTSLAFAGMKILAPDKQLQNLYPSSINICSMGSLNESIVHPREVLKSSILSNAHSVFLVHFHPSGSLLPSKEDILFSAQRVAEAGALEEKSGNENKESALERLQDAKEKTSRNKPNRGDTEKPRKNRIQDKAL